MTLKNPTEKFYRGQEGDLKDQGFEGKIDSNEVPQSMEVPMPSPSIEEKKTEPKTNDLVDLTKVPQSVIEQEVTQAQLKPLQEAKQWLEGYGIQNPTDLITKSGLLEQVTGQVMQDTALESNLAEMTSRLATLTEIKNTSPSKELGA